MSVRAMILSFVAMASLVAAPVARAGDFDKYVPANSEFYVHVSVPKLFTSEMVRKAVPMVFDKYGDQIAMMAGMAKQFNPQMPDVPEDKMKDALKDMADPQKIAKAFDAAKNVVTDIVIAGVGEGDKPNVVFLVKCQSITAEGAEMIAGMMKAFPQAGEVEVMKKTNGTIYCMTPPQSPEKVYITVPEKGILHVSMSENSADASFTGKGKPSDKLAERMAKRTAGDFFFAAGTGNGSADFTAMSVNLTLDKDLSAKFDAEFKDEATATEKAKEANENLERMVEQIKDRLGDKGENLKAHVAKTKVNADGKKVTGSFSIPGTVVEELLKKE